MSGALGTARCLAHPTEFAQATCARCGDFMCLLCGPTEPTALCHRCYARTTLDWEERGEQTLLRAFISTWLESVTRPRQVGLRLLPGGHAPMAYLYAVACFGLCLVPLALLLDALLFTFLAPSMVGFPSMTVLSLAVATALSAIAVPTILPCVGGIWALCLWVFARVLRTQASLEVLTRISVYGASLSAIPVFGPLLLPVTWVQQSLMAHAYLTQRLHLSSTQAHVATLIAYVSVLLIAVLVGFGFA